MKTYTETRFDSEYESLERLLKLKDFVNLVFPRGSDFHASDDVWGALEIAVRVLRGFAEVTGIVEVCTRKQEEICGGGGWRGVR